MKFYVVGGMNEYRYRNLQFTVHHKREAAEAEAYRRGQKRYKGNAESDLDCEIFDSIEAFKKWCEDSNYDIHWGEKYISYREKENK